MAGECVDIKCPTCGSLDVNLHIEPSVTHVPEENGWYGQAHRVDCAMWCDPCSREFIVHFSSYKNRAFISIDVENGDAHRGI